MEGVDVLRTPQDRFAALPDFDFPETCVDDLAGYEGLQVSMVDTGAGKKDDVYLCLHGEPTWSFLYRRMIPVFANDGGRVICPDWLGFGRSDKPVDDRNYTFHFHRNMMLALVERLDLTNITLVVQDWGGLLGLTLPPDMPERFSRLIVMNTALATGRKPSEGFLAWKAYAASQPDMAVGALMQRACPHLSAAEAAAYDAPFPDARYKAGVRRFPEMVMIEPGMEGIETSKRAVAFWRDAWQGQAFMAIGMQDPVLGADVMEKLRTTIRGCGEALQVADGGHFLQEWGEPVAKAALAHFKSG